MNLYLTADQVGAASGGGVVTRHESEAFKELEPCEVWGRERLEQLDTEHHLLSDPWKWDNMMVLRLPRRDYLPYNPKDDFKLAHVYAGTFSYTVEELKSRGTKVAYTAAAHDIALSRREHEKFGIDFAGMYPHLCDSELWKRYVAGYLAADVLVCPSTASANVMRGFGARNRIEVIPHGVDLPDCKRCEGTGRGPKMQGSFRSPESGYACPECKGSKIAPVAPLPSQFRVGYLGSYGCDKGVVYLLQAWAKLNLSDAVLVLGGRDSQSPFVESLIRATGARNVVCTGWINDVGDFYNQVSLYVQPSVTEGFGIEILEAMAHGRPVLCSTGVGAADLVPETRRFPAGNVEELARLIDGGMMGYAYYWNDDQKRQVQKAFRDVAENCTWPKIRARYQNLWRELLDGEVPQAAGGS